MEDKTVLGGRFLKIKLILLVIVFMSLFHSGGPALAAGPWKGRVIDAETKEPLEGAVVLAVWERYYRTPMGDDPYFYEAKEVLTDKDGRFDMPWYVSFNLLPLISYIEGPEFTIFKPGYGSIAALNNPYSWLSIYAIGPSELPYDEFGQETTATGYVVHYSVKRKKKYSEGLIYQGEGCRKKIEAMKDTTPFSIDFLYIPMTGAKEKLEKLDVPLDCPENSEPVPDSYYLYNDIAESIKNGSFRVVELPRLKTREERLRNISSFPVFVPDEKMYKLLELKYSEETELGLNPPKLRGGKK